MEKSELQNKGNGNLPVNGRTAFAESSKGDLKALRKSGQVIVLTA